MPLNVGPRASELAAITLVSLGNAVGTRDWLLRRKSSGVVDDPPGRGVLDPDRIGRSERRDHHLGAGAGRGHQPAATGPAGSRPCADRRQDLASIARSAPWGMGRTLSEAGPKVDRDQFRCSGCHPLIHPNLLALLDGL
jgi:hypothetical protein